MSTGGYDAYLEALALRESSGVQDKVNDWGYLGLYQMGEAALVDAGYYTADGTAANDWSGTWTGKDGVHSKADFLASAAGQNAAIKAYNAVQWGYITHYGLDAYLGESVGGVTVTEAGLLAGAHLMGVGNLKNFLQSGGAVVPSDGLGTPITEYFNLFGGYDITPVSGGSGGGTPVPGGGGGGGTSPPGGGGGGGLPVPGPGGGGGPVTPGVVVNPSEAFNHGSGLMPTVLSGIVVAILFMGLLVWAAWVFRGRWQAVVGHRASFGAFLFVSLRVLVVLSLLTYLLAT